MKNSLTFALLVGILNRLTVQRTITEIYSCFDESPQVFVNQRRHDDKYTNKRGGINKRCTSKFFIQIITARW